MAAKLDHLNTHKLGTKVSSRPLCLFVSFMLSSSMSLATRAHAAQKAVRQKTPSMLAARALPSGANSVAEPTQILKTGVDLCQRSISPNSKQLSDIIKLTPVLDQLSRTKANLDRLGEGITLERISARQDYMAAQISAGQIIQKTLLEIEFVEAEIDAEQNLYAELLSTFTEDRDRLVAKTNAAAFYTNGALWAVCEGLTIPTYRNSQYAIPSGITGIVAGVVPSVFSLWAMRQYNGKKRPSESQPNMLAKVFDYPTVKEVEYPNSVWEFLNTAPHDQNGNPIGRESRRDLLIDRWIKDRNIPAFTDRNSRHQLDVLTASVSQKGGLNIETLSARLAMLEQLQGEVGKIKRMLLELAMVASNEKDF